MKSIDRNCFLLLGAIVLVLLSGCGNSSPRQYAAERAADSAGAPDGINRCSLLTDDEVGMAIGPHQRGVNTISNIWGLQSCRWRATEAPKSRVPPGWFDAIEVTVFFPDKTSWAREQVEGDPVEGVAAGAVYNATDGNLWFPCARGRLCVVKLDTASGANRQKLAIQVARTVESRLR